MRILILDLSGPLMSFGGPQVDQIGRTGRFPTLSQITGLCGNALGYSHRDFAELQGLQERLDVASALLRTGQEILDYQTVDLGQTHLAQAGWTTRGRAEHRAGGPDARTGTHIRLRWFRADSVVCSALYLSSPDEHPALDDIADALDRPARPLFLGRKSCFPAAPICVGIIEADNLREALSLAPSRFSERWRNLGRGVAGDSVEAEWPIPAGELVENEVETATHRLLDQRDWRNQLHVGERVVARGSIVVQTPASANGSQE